jgi:hypothetical protein
MLTIIHLLSLPLSLEVNSGPQEPFSRTAKRQPLVAVQEQPHLLARTLAPTAATATTASTFASQAVDRTPLRLSPLPRASRQEPLQPSTAFQPSSRHCKPTNKPLQRPTASYKPSSRLHEPQSLCSRRQPSSRRTVTASHHKPLQRLTASYKPSSRLQEPLQPPTAFQLSYRHCKPQQASAAFDSLLPAVVPSLQATTSL